MDPTIGLILIIAPIAVAFVMLAVLKKAADTTGIVVWLLTLVFAIFAFQTDIMISLVASVVGIIKSFPISLMVATSILMMTYMQESGALGRMIVFFKTLGGGSKPLQIMLISLGLGTFLVGIGATPVSMLPPVMLALGFSPLVAVALPAIGYDPLTTFALLGVPVQVFTDVYSGVSGSPLELWYAGGIFSMYMPIITSLIAIGMLWIAGGRELLFSREGLGLAALSGITAGVVAIITNSSVVASLFPTATVLTNVFAGAAVILVLIGYTKAKGRPLINREKLTEYDKRIEGQMGLKKASIPWIILVVLCLAATLVEFIRVFLFDTLDFVIPVWPDNAIKTPYYDSTLGINGIHTHFMWQAYTLMLIATLVSIPFLRHDRVTLKNTFRKFKSRAPRPVLAAAIFFAMAEVMTRSGYYIDPLGNWAFPYDPTNNMIFLLASVTSQTLGQLYPLIAAFVGLLGGFVSGSETSTIAMFTGYNYQTSVIIGANPIVVSASNGIGGGLASVLSPAKIQNAAAVIDEIGIEGEVLRYGAVIAILITLFVAILTFLWAYAFIPLILI